MNIRLGVPRTFATAALAITMLLATFSPHASTIDTADAAEAGIDGEHIYAGISYESDPSLDRCEWVLPETVHQLGVRAGLTIRYWNGISWTLYNCERGGESRLVWLPDISVETAAESTRDVVRDRVPQLLHNFSPAPHKGIVKTPTWFWVHPALWRPVSVTARVPTPRGIVTMTTTATPSSLEFHPGDGTGDLADCDGPGLSWSPLLPSFVDSDCTYEYPIPSAHQQGGVFRARLDVVWSVTWRTNVGGRVACLICGSVPHTAFGYASYRQ